jgi:predicted 3-demethylubiquinone-9 3-methyltransferase (glyoxalase superfamily)
MHILFKVNAHCLRSLWFDGKAEEAASFYTSIFPNSKIAQTSRYLEAGKEYHGQDEGSVMTVVFELDGHPFVALNGGPLFKFSPATSFQVDCKDQAEVDFFWERLGEGGDPTNQQCGWLTDKFGVSWQVVPNALLEMVLDDDKAKVG